MGRAVAVGKIKIGKGNPFVLIAGPCVIENRKTTINLATSLKKITSRLKVPFIFKVFFMYIKMLF